MSPNILLGAAAGELTAQIVTIIIAFSITVYVLHAVAWKPILKLIDERRETIAKEFDSLEKKQAGLDSRIKDYEERLRQIDQEARERLNKAIDEGKRIGAEIVEDSRRQADDLRAKASSDIKLELDKTRIQLRDDMVRITISATEKLIQKQLDDQGHRDLVVSFITELESRKAS